MAGKQGKGARAKAKQRRKNAKEKAKASRKALYKAYAESGNNSKDKSVRARRKGTKNKLICVFDHPNGPCGNIGCKRTECHS